MVYKFIGWSPGHIYLLKVNRRKIRKMCEICLKLTINAVLVGHSGVFILILNIVYTFFSVSIVDFSQGTLFNRKLAIKSFV